MEGEKEQEHSVSVVPAVNLIELNAIKRKKKLNMFAIAADLY